MCGIAHIYINMGILHQLSFRRSAPRNTLEISDLRSYLNNYEYCGEGVDISRRATVRQIRQVLNLLSMLGSPGHTVYAIVQSDLSVIPIVRCFLGWLDGDVCRLSPPVVALVESYLVAYTDFSPDRLSRVEGIVDPEVAAAWSEQMRPTALKKRGRSDSQGTPKKPKRIPDEEAPWRRWEY